MGEPNPHLQPLATRKPAQERLESWKEIAHYLKRTVRTVQRWEKLEDLPVHRHAHEKMSTVYAYPAEIDAWWNERHMVLKDQGMTEETESVPAAAGWRWWPWMASLLVTISGAVLYFVSLRSAGPFERHTVTSISTSGTVTWAAISPGARHLAYATTERSGHCLRLRILPEGSDTLLVTYPNGTFKGLTFSPDGDQIYYVLEEGGHLPGILFKIGVLGGIPKRVKTGLNSPISFSPDGSRFAYIKEEKGSGDSALLIATVDGSGERRIANRKLPDYLDYPAWSPDGSLILCTSFDFREGKAFLVEVSLAGGAERTIWTRDGSLIRQPHWLAGGRLVIVSAKDPDTGVFQLWRLAPNGKVRKITNDLDNYFRVSLSKDSETLVTVQEEVISSLWITPTAKASGALQVASGATWHSAVGWTRDGRIVYDKPAGRWRNLWIMDWDGANQKQLTADASNVDPSVCGHGRDIVYLSNRSGELGVWRIGIDGGDSKQLIEVTRPAAPCCSPDGKWVVYTALASGRWPTLWKAPIEGGDAAELNRGHSRLPAISPDGRRIAVFYVDPRDQPSLQEASASIAVIPMEGGEPELIFPIGRTVDQAARLRWTPDGKAISYVETRERTSEIWSQPLDGSPPHPAGDLKADRILSFDWSADGKYLCFSQGTQKRSLLLIRNLR